MKFPSYKPATILIIDTITEMGGAQVTLLSLLKNLDRKRFHPVVVIPDTGRHYERLSEENIETHIIPMSQLVETKNPFSLMRYPFDILAVVWRLARLAKKKKAGLIHTNSLRAHIYGCLAARLVGLPVVPHLQDLPKNRLLRKSLYWMFGLLAEKVVVNSKAVGATLSDGRTCEKRIVLIYPAVEIQDFDPSISPDRVKHEFDLSCSYPVVGMLGHIVRWKGHEDFIRAAAILIREFPDAKLLIVGSDHFCSKRYIDSLNDLIRKEGIGENSVFTGFRSDIPEILTSFDLLVLASWGEPFGRVIIEAMAMKKPVVATAMGGPLEIIVDGVTGRLVPIKDPSAMAKAIIEIASDRELAGRMGEAGRRRVEEMFALDRYLSAFEQLFEEILKP